MRRQAVVAAVILALTLAAGPAAAELRGKVLQVRADFGFAFIDLGLASGVQPGMVFIVLDSNGNPAARVRITRVYNDLSEGDLIEQMRAQALHGDLEVVEERTAPPTPPPTPAPAPNPTPTPVPAAPAAAPAGEFVDRVTAELVRSYDQRGVVEHPLAVTVGPDRRIYFLDTKHHALLVWNEGNPAALPTHAALTAPGGVYYGREAGQFVFPGAVTTDRAGNVYVVDTMNHRVQVFDRTGKFKRELGGLGTGPGKLMKPGGIAVANSGEIFVADTGNDRVQVFGANGNFIRSITGLSRPFGLAFGADGKLLVADSRNRRIAVYEPTGAYLKSFGSDVLVAPRGIDVADTTGIIFVADPGAGNVQVFDRGGNRLGTVEHRYLEKPFDVDWDPALGLLVADPGSDALHQFKITIAP